MEASLCRMTPTTYSGLRQRVRASSEAPRPRSVSGRSASRRGRKKRSNASSSDGGSSNSSSSSNSPNEHLTRAWCRLTRRRPRRLCTNCGPTATLPVLGKSSTDLDCSTTARTRPTSIPVAAAPAATTLPGERTVEGVWVVVVVAAERDLPAGIDRLLRSSREAAATFPKASHNPYDPIAVLPRLSRRS